MNLRLTNHPPARALALAAALVALPHIAAAQTAPLPTPNNWTYLALEGASFSVTPAQTVYYGNRNNWVSKSVNGSASCSNAFFGTDPLPGLKKACVTPASAAPTGIAWQNLGNDGSNFSISGTQTVRYGAGGDWVQRSATTSGTCSVTFFGFDPAPGRAKTCQWAQAIVSHQPPDTAGPCAWAAVGSACKIDAIGYQTLGTNDTSEEVVMAYGRLWRYTLQGAMKQPSADLKSVTRYGGGAVFGGSVPGPCTYSPAGQPCRIDSLTLLYHDSWGYVESISAYGRGFNFDANGNPWGSGGSNFELTSITRYGGGAVFGGSAQGPCSFRPSGEACKFDTRTFVDARQEWGDYYESITAYGRYFLFDSAGTPVESNTLASVTRYANGPCAHAPAGSTCKFDSLDFKRVNGRLVEVITAYGRYWEFYDKENTPIPGAAGVPLQNVARFR